MQEIRRFKPSTVSRRFSVAAGCIAHTEIVEYTARGILRTFEQLCAEASKKERP
jgi:hypothetical protein